MQLELLDHAEGHGVQNITLYPLRQMSHPKKVQSCMSCKQKSTSTETIVCCCVRQHILHHTGCCECLHHNSKLKGSGILHKDPTLLQAKKVAGVPSGGISEPQLECAILFGARMTVRTSAFALNVKHEPTPRRI